MRVAVLGTGIMGAPMARNLTAKHDVVVWNRTREKAEGLGALARAVPRADLVAGGGDVARHRRAHDPRSEDGDAHQWGH